nr:hypothetical protein [Bacteroidota bacterium]
MIKEKKYALISILGFSTFFLFNIYLFEGSCYFTGDGLRHYMVSRWCWQHPDLLFYHWGKPFFTIIASPFAHFGHGGIQVFNVIVSAIGIWCLFLMTHKHQIKNAWLVVPFSYLCIGFFTVINTGLTEPLFFCMIASCAWLAYDKKYLLSAFIISFLPFVRSEGNLILVLFALVFLLRKKYFIIPILAAGTIIYSIAGYFHYNDILWVFTKNPYDGKNKDIYGHGELFTFVKAYQSVVGNPYAVLLVLGTIVLLWNKIKNKIVDHIFSPEMLLLVYGSFALYFTAHSVFWWKGLYNSLGLTRVMGGVVPLIAPLCVIGANSLIYWRKEKLYKYAWSCVLAFYFMFEPLRLNFYPYELPAEEKVILETYNWIKTNNLQNRHFYYLNPFFASKIDRDAFDPNIMRELWGLYPNIHEWGYSVVPDTTLIIYDTHFGANEARIHPDSILNDTHFELLKTFKPDEPFEVLGGYNYMVQVYKKKPMK